MLNIDTTKKTLSFVALPVFILIVQWLWGWSNIVKPWAALSLPAVFVAATFIIISYQLRTLRIYDYFTREISGRWWLNLKLVLIHNTLNNLLPMRSGEVSFPLLMKRYFNIEFHHSLPALLWFRLLDLHTVLGIVIIPFVHTNVSPVISIPVMLLWLSIPFVAYLLKNFLLLHIKDSSRLRIFIRKTLLGLPTNGWQFTKCWFLTLINWALKILVLVWLLGQFINATFITKLSAIIGGELTSVLPFHAPGGFGTYEAGIATPLVQFIDTELAIQSAINVHLFILSVSIIGGVAGYLIPAPSITINEDSERLGHDLKHQEEP